MRKFVIRVEERQIEQLTKDIADKLDCDYNIHRLDSNDVPYYEFLITFLGENLPAQDIIDTYKEECRDYFIKMEEVDESFDIV